MKEGTRHLLEKAERAIQAADVLLTTVGAEFAAGRAYYAMFYTAEALLHERDQKFSKHDALHAAYGKEFTKSGLLDPKFHRWLLNAFDVRLQEDYDAERVSRKLARWSPPRFLTPSLLTRAPGGGGRIEPGVRAPQARRPRVDGPQGILGPPPFRWTLG